MIASISDPSLSGLIVLAIITFIANMLVSALGTYLQYLAAKKAREDAATLANAGVKAQEDAAIAQRNAAVAQRQAADAARALVEAAKDTDKHLTHIAEVGDATHKIVNNQRTMMLRQLVLYARRILKDNPRDKEAAQALKDAEQDLATADAANGT